MKPIWTNIALFVHFISSIVILALLFYQLHYERLLKDQVVKDTTVITILALAEAQDQTKLQELAAHCTQPTEFYGNQP